MTEFLGMLRSWIFCAMAAASLPTFAAPVIDALARPAVATPAAVKAYLTSVAVAGKRLVAAGERGVVLLSDDGGASWKQAAVPVSVSLTALHFVDDQRGYAVGHAGVVLGTTDGGQSWSKLLDGERAAQLLLDAAKRSGNAAALQEATRVAADGPDKPLLDLHFFDGKRGLVVGAYNLAFETLDGGASWTAVSDRFDNAGGFHLYAMRVRGRTVVLAGEQGTAFRSDDEGHSFRRMTVPYKGSFFTAELPSEHEILLGGLRGNVWRSLDRGATWTQVPMASQASIVASAQSSSGRLLLVNQAGDAFVGHGDQFRSVAHRIPPLNGLVTLPDGRVLGASRFGPVVLDAGSVQ
ncbi:MAG TPA: YCF48-related protein [Rhizobacter sp.]|nr:YCF48-related protein [Rhizobacter sp.]